MRINMYNKRNVLIFAAIILIGFLCTFINLRSYQNAYATEHTFQTLNQISPSISFMTYDQKEMAKKDLLCHLQEFYMEVGFSSFGEIEAGSGFYIHMEDNEEFKVVFKNEEKILYDNNGTEIGKVHIPETGNPLISFSHNVKKNRIEPVYLQSIVLYSGNGIKTNTVSFTLTNFNEEEDTKQIQKQIRLGKEDEEGFTHLGSGIFGKLDIQDMKGASIEEENPVTNGQQVKIKMRMKSVEKGHGIRRLQIQLPDVPGYGVYFLGNPLPYPQDIPIYFGKNENTGFLQVTAGGLLTIALERYFPLNEVVTVDFPFHAYINPEMIKAGGSVLTGSSIWLDNNIYQQYPIAFPQHYILSPVYVSPGGLYVAESVLSLNGATFSLSLEYGNELFVINKGDMILVEFEEAEGYRLWNAVSDFSLKNSLGQTVGQMHMVEDKEGTYVIIFSQDIPAGTRREMVNLYMAMALENTMPPGDYTQKVSVNKISRNYPFTYSPEGVNQSLIAKAPGQYHGQNNSSGVYRVGMENTLASLQPVRWEIYVNGKDLTNDHSPLWVQQPNNAQPSRGDMIRRQVTIQDSVMAENHYIVEDSIHIVRVLEVKNDQMQNANNLIVDQRFLKPAINRSQVILTDNPENSVFYNMRGLTFSEFRELIQEEEKGPVNLELAYDSFGNVGGFTYTLGQLNSPGSETGAYQAVIPGGTVTNIDIPKQDKDFGYFVYYDTKLSTFEGIEYTSRELTQEYGTKGFYWEENPFAKDFDDASFSLTYIDRFPKVTTASNLIIKKVDIYGNPISHVEFQLRGPQITQTATTDRNGYALFTYITEGTYTLVESKRPNRYKVMEPLTFHVGNDAATYIQLSDYIVVRQDILRGSGGMVNGKAVLTSEMDNIIINYPLDGKKVKIYQYGAVQGRGYGTVEGKPPESTLYSLTNPNFSMSVPLDGSGNAVFDSVPPGYYQMETVEGDTGSVIEAKPLDLTENGLENMPVDEEGYAVVDLDRPESELADVILQLEEPDIASGYENTPADANSPTYPQKAPNLPAAYKDPVTGSPYPNPAPPYPLSEILGIDREEEQDQEAPATSEEQQTSEVDAGSGNQRPTPLENDNMDNLSYTQPEENGVYIIYQDNVPLGYWAPKDGEDIEDAEIPQDIKPFFTPKVNPNTGGL